MIIAERELIGGVSLPVILRVRSGRDSSLPHIIEWFKENKELLQSIQCESGAVVVRGLRAIDSPKAFAAVLEAVAPNLMDYLGGTAPRSVAYGNVFNATALPGTFSLPLHQEMAYQAHRPDRLALCSLQVASAGGETTIADARVITATLDSSLKQKCRAGLSIRRYLPEVKDESVARPWCDVFGTSSRDEVLRISSEKGWNVTWRKDNSMHLRQPMPVFKEHRSAAEPIWANQSHYHNGRCMLRWALRDSREQEISFYSAMLQKAPDRLDQVYFADGTIITTEEADHIWDVCERSEVPFKWQKGDVMFLDNTLVMHGRMKFTGERSVVVGLVKDE